jgi:hypothetical protein
LECLSSSIVVYVYVLEVLMLMRFYSEKKRKPLTFDLNLGNETTPVSSTSTSQFSELENQRNVCRNEACNF